MFVNMNQIYFYIFIFLPFLSIKWIFFIF